MKKKYFILPVSLGIIIGLPYQLDKTTYKLYSSKIKSPVRFIVLSDIHGSRYGKCMSKLLKKIDEAKADAILMPGDIFDEYSKDDSAFELLQGLRKYPCFYSTGNHEEKRDDLPSLKKEMKELGIKVLDNFSEVITIRDNVIEVAGIACRNKEKAYDREDINSSFKTNNYRILLSHKPQWIKLYNAAHCDLIISGHAHGGQICFPFTKKGLIAPDQGLLPAYTNGIHHLKNKELIISRGLAKDYHGIPRLYNNPEYIILDILPI